MAEGAVLPVETMTGPVAGRSLWAEARGRLVRNRAAVTSIIVLALIALACIFGPFFTGHPFDRVYPDYVRVPASLEAYPKADQIEPNIERIGARVRAKAEDITIDGDVVRMTLVSSSARPIDERLLAYFERSDLFGPARSSERAGRGPAPRRRRADRAPALPVRHRRQRPRSPDPHHEGRPRLARHRPARDLRRDPDRRHLRRDLRLSRRTRRPRDDAHRRHPLLAALHLLRDHAGRVLRPQLRPDVHRGRRGRMARHGAHRPRPDALDQAPGIRAGGGGARRRRRRASSAATSSRTRSGPSSST